MATSIAESRGHQVGGLSFTDEELAERRKSLGASEIGPVAGLSKSRTPLDVWAEKRGMVPPFLGNEYTEWGLRLEEPIRQKYIEVTGNAVEKVGRMVGNEGWMSASPDGLIPGQLGLEVKRFGEHRLDDFGPAGTDQVPHDVASQCVWGMMVCGVTLWDVAVLLGQANFRIYHLRRDEAVAEHLYTIGRRFWFEHVVPGIEPEIDGSTASHRYLQQKFKTHTQILLPPTPEQVSLAHQLRTIKKQIAEMEFEASGLEAQLKLAIGEAAGLDGLCTWKAPRSGYVSWKDIAHEIAGGMVPGHVVQAHTKEPTRRFLLTGKEK